MTAPGPDPEPTSEQKWAAILGVFARKAEAHLSAEQALAEVSRIVAPEMLAIVREYRDTRGMPKPVAAAVRYLDAHDGRWECAADQWAAEDWYQRQRKATEALAGLLGETA